MTELLYGDVVEQLQSFGDRVFDGVLADAPYGISILGEVWDDAGSDGDSATNENQSLALRFQRQCYTWGRAVLRVVKPGAFLLVFGSPRTYHRLACGLEDAGWQVRDTIGWLHGQGFPKSRNIAKGIDDRLGATRQVLGHRSGVGTAPRGHGFKSVYPATIPATNAARHWTGYGTALKPAFEPILVAMRPIEESYARNAMFHGVAGLNIDGCRIGNGVMFDHQEDTPAYSVSGNGAGRQVVGEQAAGRYPANIMLGHHPECRETGTISVPGQILNRHLDGAKPFGNGAGHPFTTEGTPPQVHPIFDCHPACPVGQLGSKSRFFYCPKPSRAEKNAGLEDFPAKRKCHLQTANGTGQRWDGMTHGFPDTHVPNHHPTVKPISLTTYLAKLILPPARYTPRKLLVPFCGSGSEIIGAQCAGWDSVVGIDNNAEYLEIARARIAHANHGVAESA